MSELKKKLMKLLKIRIDTDASAQLAVFKINKALYEDLEV
jgi:hypothetical protein